MKCQKCGTENKNESKFCINCGSELKENEPKQKTKNLKITNKFLIIYTAVILVLTLIFSRNVVTILGIILIIVPLFLKIKNQQNAANELNTKFNNANDDLCELYRSKNELQTKFDALGFNEYYQTEAEIKKLEKEISNLNQTIVTYQARIAALSEEREKINKQLKTATNKLSKSKEIYRSIDYSIKNYFNYIPTYEQCKLSPQLLADFEELAPSVTLNLHCMDLKDLRKAFNDNKKQIETVKEQYSGRYTTKVNQALYDLIVVALDSELQNILTCLKYEKLDVGVEAIKSMTSKYLSLVSKANQNMVGTLSSFLGSMEYLYINAVNIEYNYYIRKEQARQEQIAIREQMRQEAKERKELAQQKAKLEEEEKKFRDEIENVQKLIKEASEEEVDSLKAKIITLENQISEMIVKKDEIVKLQNGKAGNVYIISNLGSFGENMFKVGMTRRLEPQERIDELGSASVPFEFDVHCFIFSNDAVKLENLLHEKLNDKRVNKVNLRKEFFYSSVDELEALVREIDPDAKFTRTMAAKDYRQSISTDNICPEFDYESESDLEEYLDDVI